MNHIIIYPGMTVEHKDLQAKRDLIEEFGMTGRYHPDIAKDLEQTRTELERLKAHDEAEIRSREARKAAAEARREANRPIMEAERERTRWRLFPLDTPKVVAEHEKMPKTKVRCQRCGGLTGLLRETIAPRAGECVDCTRLTFEELTAPKIPGGDSKRTEQWKMDNLHVYLEQAYREQAEAVQRVPVLRPFTVLELLERHGNTCAAQRCPKLWAGMQYVRALDQGGSWSLENVRPACTEHRVYKA